MGDTSNGEGVLKSVGWDVQCYKCSKSLGMWFQVEYPHDELCTACKRFQAWIPELVAAFRAELVKE